MGGKQDPSLQGFAGAVGPDSADAITKIAGLHSGMMYGAQNVANTSTDAGNWWHQATHAVEGLASGAVRLGKSAFNTVNRTLLTAGEALTGGFLGAHGFGQFSANLHDANQTLANFTGELTPAAVGRNFQHLVAYYDSLVQRKGYAYAIGDLTANAIPAMFGGEVLTGAGMANEAVDLGTIANLAAKVQRGGATEADIARYSAASARQMRRNSAQAVFDEAKARNADNFAKVLSDKTKAFRTGLKFTDNPVLRWTVGMPLRGAGAAIRATNGLKAQTFYGLTGMSAQASPENQYLWEQTKDGHAIDPYGKKLGTMGQQVADMLGLAHSSWERSLLSGGVDATTMFMGDPFATYGHLRQGINSAEGFGGVLGKWWSGIGFETGADIQRSWDKTSDTRRAFEYMATHSADEINTAFKGMFPPDVLVKLGDAKNTQEVVDVLAGLADSHALAFTVLPTLGIMRKSFAALKNFFYREVGYGIEDADLHNVFVQYFDKFGIKADPRSTVEAQSVDWSRRAATSVSRTTAKQFDQVPWFIEEATKTGELPRVQNSSFLIGDKNAIPAIVSWYRATGLWNRYEIDNLARVLRAAPNSNDAYRALLNLNGHMMMAAALRQTGGKFSQEWVNDELRKFAMEEVQKMLDMGIGGQGSYLNGKLGDVLSKVYNPDNYNQFGMFGIGNTHAGRASFLDPRQLVGLVDAMSKALKVTHLGIDNSVAELRTLQDAEVVVASQLKGATLKGVPDKLRTAIDELNAKFDGSLTIEPKAPPASYYHGSATRIDKIGDIWSSDSNNLFGPGFYTTDNPDIARSYTFKGAQQAGKQGQLNQTVHGISWVGDTPPKMLDLEQPAPDFLRRIIQEEFESLNFAFSDVLSSQLKDPNITGADLYQSFRHEMMDEMRDLGWTKYDFLDSMDSIRYQLSNMGYDGMTHLGGTRMGRGEVLHNVNIFFDPEAKLAITSVTPNKIIDPMVQYLKAGSENAFRKVEQLIANVASDRFANVALQVSKQTQRLEEMLKNVDATKEQVLEAKRQAYLTALNNGDMQAMQAARQMPGPTDEYIATLRGELAGFRMAERQLFSQLSEPSLSLRDFRESVWMKAATNAEEKRIEKEIRATAAEKLAEFRKENGSYLDYSGLTSDRANKALSRWFLPQMLSTGGYIMRIGTSELLPSLARIGPRNYIASMLGRSVEKHLRNAPPLVKGEKELVFREVQSAADHLFAMAKEKFNKGASKVSPFFVGALTGAELAILKGMSPERAERMLDDFVGAMLNTGGHAPDISHNTSSLFTPENVSHHMQQETYGVEEGTGNPIKSRMYRTGKFVKASGEHIGNALQENLMRLRHDEILRLPVKELDRIARIEGYSAFGSTDAQNALWSRLTDAVYKELVLLPDAEQQIYRRSSWLLDSEHTTGDPIKDWAKAVSYNAMHVMGGFDKAGNYVLHPELLQQVITGDILPAHELAAWAVKNPAHPKDLIAAEFTKYPWRSSGAGVINRAFDALSRLPNKANAMFVDKVFGHFIPWVSREPLFLWEYHMSMENLRGHVAEGIISQDAAELMSLNQAFRRMVSFVHNPADRALFEKNTRWLAPFWFAKNQAYRRSFRFMEDNPGAFVYYLRLSFAISNGLHDLEKKNARLEIPHSSWAVNFLGWLTSGFHWQDYGINLALNPSSLKTISPLGDEFGTRMAMPDFGTFVSIADHVAKPFLGNEKWFQSLSETLLGPIGSKTGIMNDLVPAPIIRGAGTLGYDVIANWNQTPSDALQANIQQEAYTRTMDRVWNGFIQQYYREHPNLNLNDLHNQAVAWAENQMVLLYHDKSKWHDLMNQAHHASYGIYLAKIIAGAVMPAAVSLRTNFTAYKEFNDIMKRKNPDGSPYSFQQGMYDFSIEHPDQMLDLISKSENPFGSLAETKQFMKYYDSAPQLFENGGVPTFMAYMIPRGGAYDSSAHQAQIAHGLRQRANNDQFYDNFMTTLGNDIYYRSFEPYYYSQFGRWEGENSPNNIITSYGRNQMTRAAKKWGEMVNPTWLKNGSPFGFESKVRQQTAIEEATKFVNDRTMYMPLIQSGMLTQYDIDTLRSELEWRNQYQQVLNYIPSVSQQWPIKSMIFNHFNELAQDPKNERLANFFTSVLAKEQQ